MLDLAVVESGLHEVVPAEEVEAHAVEDLEAVLAEAICGWFGSFPETRLGREMNAQPGQFGSRASLSWRANWKRASFSVFGVMTQVWLTRSRSSWSSRVKPASSVTTAPPPAILADEIVRRLRVVQPEAPHEGLAVRRVVVDLRDDARLAHRPRERRVRVGRPSDSSRFGSTPTTAVALRHVCS